MSRNSAGTIFHAMCLIVIGMLPVSAFANNSMVIHEVKHDRTLRGNRERLYPPGRPTH